MGPINQEINFQEMLDALKALTRGSDHVRLVYRPGVNADEATGVKARLPKTIVMVGEQLVATLRINFGYNPQHWLPVLLTGNYGHHLSPMEKRYLGMALDRHNGGFTLDVEWRDGAYTFDDIT